MCNSGASDGGDRKGDGEKMEKSDQTQDWEGDLQRDWCRCGREPPFPQGPHGEERRGPITFPLSK